MSESDSANPYDYARINNQEQANWLLSQYSSGLKGMESHVTLAQFYTIVRALFESVDALSEQVSDLSEQVAQHGAAPGSLDDRQARNFMAFVRSVGERYGLAPTKGRGLSKAAQGLGLEKHTLQSLLKGERRPSRADLAAVATKSGLSTLHILQTGRRMLADEAISHGMSPAEPSYLRPATT